MFLLLGLGGFGEAAAKGAADGAAAAAERARAAEDARAVCLLLLNMGTGFCKGRQGRRRGKGQVASAATECLMLGPFACACRPSFKRLFA